VNHPRRNGSHPRGQAWSAFNQAAIAIGLSKARRAGVELAPPAWKNVAANPQASARITRAGTLRRREHPVREASRASEKRAETRKAAAASPQACRGMLVWLRRLRVRGGGQK